MKRITIIGALFMALLLSQGWVASAFSEPNKITLGDLNSFTGSLSLFGKDSRVCIDVAVEEINAKGGVDVAGKRYLVEVIHLDNKYEPAASVAGYRRLVDLHGVRFIHSQGTRTTQALMGYNEKDGVLIDFLSAASRETTSGNKLMLGASPMTNGFDPPVVKEAVKRGLKTVCIIADDSDTGRDPVATVVPLFTKLGGKVLALEYVKAPTTVDFMPVLTKLKGYNPDFLYLMAQEQPNARIAKQARQAGFKGPLVFNMHFKGRTIDVVGIESLEGSLHPGTPTSFMAHPIPGGPPLSYEFRNRILKKVPNHQFAVTGAYGYNFVYYITRAMQLAGTTTDVWKVRKACSQAIAETKVSVSFEGCSEGGRFYGQMLYVLGIDNGKQHVIDGAPYTKEQASEGEK